MLSARASIALVLSISVSIAGLAAQDRQKSAKAGRPDFRGERLTTSAISGSASSARHCIGPSGANVHTVGWVPGSTEVVVTFTSDFDPVAAITIVQMGQDAPDRLARVSYLADDDSGGNLEPEIRFRTEFSGTLNLHVSKYSGERDAGCYFYKVEIRTP